MTPVDYKHGRPREDGEDGLELWPADRAQLAVQAMVLRENGYRCEEGIVYYRKTGQRVRVAFDDAVIAETEALIARRVGDGGGGRIPPPLVDSPKCPGCSLVGICLPDETRRAADLRRRRRTRDSSRCSKSRGGSRLQARGAAADDAAERIAAAVPEHAGPAGGQERARCCR